jgi:hypothetical protein
MYSLIKATSSSLAQYLRSQILADPVLAPDFTGGGLMISLNNPEEMSESNHRGISLWLYRVVRDEQLLNAPRVRNGDRLFRPNALPLRLHYLVTPIAQIDPETGPQTEHMLLGKVLQVFHDHPVLRGSDFIEELAGAEFSLHVRLEPLSLEEITQVWEALQRPYQLCVSYQVSVVPISSAVEPQSLAPVEQVTSDFAVIVPAEDAL